MKETPAQICAKLSELSCPGCGRRFSESAAAAAADAADESAARARAAADEQGRPLRHRVLHPLKCDSCGKQWLVNLRRRTFRKKR